MEFEAGVPVAVNGEKMRVSARSSRSSTRSAARTASASSTSWRTVLIGMKDHGIYETPGGTILYFAHEQLEMLTARQGDGCTSSPSWPWTYADLIYNGKWYTAAAGAR